MAPPPPTVLGLIGGFELHAGDAAVALPLSAQRLVAFVALQPRAVQRLYVSGVLWPDSGEEQAKASLRSALWRVHRVAGRVLVACGSHLALAPHVAVDVTALATLAHRALDAPRTLDEHAARALSASGELLPDWYDDWLAIERERVRQLRLHALEAICADLVRRERFCAAVEAGLAAVAAEPLRESAHRALIRAHVAEGNRGEALRQFESYRSMLRRHVGVEPSAELRALVYANAAPRDAAVTGP